MKSKLKSITLFNFLKYIIILFICTTFIYLLYFFNEFLPLYLGYIQEIKNFIFLKKEFFIFLLLILLLLLIYLIKIYQKKLSKKWKLK